MLEGSTFGLWHVFAATIVGAVVMQRHPATRNVLLLVGSYVFYIALAPRFAWALAALTLMSFFIAFPLAATRSRLLLWVSIALHLSLLLTFKYANFFLENIERVAKTLGFFLDAPTLSLILPLGISFYTFQALGYTVDIYRGNLKPTRNIVHYALFLGFFPKISAGPIERAGNFLPQMTQASPLRWDLINRAFSLLMWGAVLKFVIADNAALIANPLFDSPAAFQSSLPGVLAYMLQIFADFSGYSLMAKGGAALLGIRLSWNFAMPYLARSPQDFWKRWHISLSEWFKDYVYIPLGGNRRGTARTYANLLLTMTLVGLWHGATWMFVLWGLYHGILLCVHRLMKHSAPKDSRPVLGPVFTFAAVALGWILFRSQTIGSAWEIFRKLSPQATDASLSYVILLWIPVLFMHALEIISGDREVIAKLPLFQRMFFYVVAFYLLLYLPPFTAQQFIYVQF